MQPFGRALVVRIGALGDVVLTRRLSYSLWLAGFRITLFAPARHASLLVADSWIDGVLDSESPEASAAFRGEWPERAGRFAAAAVVSMSEDLARAAECAADRVVRISNRSLSQSKGPSVASMGASAASTVASTSSATGSVLVGSGSDSGSGSASGSIRSLSVSKGPSVGRQWAEAAAGLAAPFTGTVPDLPASASRSLASGAALIHPGSGSPSKNWPMERFVEMGLQLKRAGHRVLWIRGPAESAFPDGASEFEIIDRPRLDVLAATLAKARVFIGNDSGVSHLAGAVGAPTVAIFGPTDAAIWRPDGRRVRTVTAESGELADISVDAVLAAVAEVGGGS